MGREKEQITKGRQTDTKERKEKKKERVRARQQWKPAYSQNSEWTKTWKQMRKEKVEGRKINMQLNYQHKI